MDSEMILTYVRTLRTYAVTVCDYKERWSGIVTSSHENHRKVSLYFPRPYDFLFLFSVLYIRIARKDRFLSIFHLLRSK